MNATAEEQRAFRLLKQLRAESAIVVRHARFISPDVGSSASYSVVRERMSASPESLDLLTYSPLFLVIGDKMRQLTRGLGELSGFEYSQLQGGGEPKELRVYASETLAYRGSPWYVSFPLKISMVGNDVLRRNLFPPRGPNEEPPNLWYRLRRLSDFLADRVIDDLDKARQTGITLCSNSKRALAMSASVTLWLRGKKTILHTGGLFLKPGRDAATTWWVEDVTLQEGETITLELQLEPDIDVANDFDSPNKPLVFWPERIRRTDEVLVGP